MLHSSVKSPDTPTCCQNRANITAFTQDILATNILHDQLVGYMWESSLAKDRQDNQNLRDRTQLQKGDVIYSHMIDRDIIAAGDCIQA